MTSLQTLDWSAVKHCILYYENGKGSRRGSKPTEPTVNGQLLEKNEYAPYIYGYEGETLLDRAARLEILDVWTPICIVKAKFRRRYEFVGDEAIYIYKTWKEKNLCPQ